MAIELTKVRGIPVLPNIDLPFTQGDIWHVKPGTGSNSNTGKSPDQALATLAQAHSLATANQNDIVLLYAESNTAADTTDYQSSTLTWSKDLVHLIGVGAPTMISQRSRIAFLSTYDTASNLMTISADGCIFKNISIFAGVAGTNPTGCLNVTGQRNYFDNCHVAGIGHANNDIADAYSLQISGGSENTFRNCTIGLDTIARGTNANSEIRFVSGATRNVFIDCNITTYAEAAGHQFVLVPINGLDRYTIFKNCLFINMTTGDAAGTTMTEAFDVTGGGSPDGLILLHGCTLFGATDWEAATVSGKVMIRTDGGTAATAGLSADVAAS